MTADPAGKSDPVRNDVLAGIYPARAEYGSGIFRRRIRVRNGRGVVTAVLNDSYHSMWVALRHDGKTVTAVESELNRFPKTTCPAATSVLTELRGLAVNADRRAFFRDGRAGRNCTHLLDMALLALRVMDRGDSEAVFDVEIPDVVGGRTELIARINGKAIHHWHIGDDRITAPAEFAGTALFGGFAAWAESSFDGAALDAARIAQKSVFVSKGLAYKVDGELRVRALAETHRHGQCHSFSSPSVEVAMDNIGYVIDTTAGLDEPNLARAMARHIAAGT